MVPSRPVAALALMLMAQPAPGAEVAVLASSDSPERAAIVAALLRAAPHHSFAEYGLGGDQATAQRVVQQLAGQIDVFVALGRLAAQSARAFAPDTPLVFCMIDRPRELDLLGSPHVGGIAHAVPVKNQLAVFRMVYPRGVRIALLHNPENTKALAEEAQKAARVVHLAVMEHAIRSPSDVASSVKALGEAGETVDAIWVPADAFFRDEAVREALIELAFKAKLPVYSSLADWVEQGALAALAPDLDSIGEQAATLVDRLVAGDAEAIALRVPRGRLLINRKTAKKLKINLPLSAVKAAAKVY